MFISQKINSDSNTNIIHLNAVQSENNTHWLL